MSQIETVTTIKASDAVTHNENSAPSKAQWNRNISSINVRATGTSEMRSFVLIDHETIIG